MKVQVGGVARCQRVSADGPVTWTVIDGTDRVVEPVEEFLEFGRQSAFSANTIRSYATALALWVRHLDARGRDWDSIDVRELGRFADTVRHGRSDSYLHRPRHGCQRPPSRPGSARC